jgi:hypothetical protein
MSHRVGYVCGGVNQVASKVVCHHADSVRHWHPRAVPGSAVPVSEIHQGGPGAEEAGLGIHPSVQPLLRYSSQVRSGRVLLRVALSLCVADVAVHVLSNWMGNWFQGPVPAVITVHSLTGTCV